MPAAKPANVKAAVLAEHRKGNRTVRGIRDALKRKGIAISIGTVSTYLQAATAASEAVAKPARKMAKAKTEPSAAPPVRAAELVAEVRDAAQAHAAAWERLYQAHALALAEVERRLAALGHQTACAKCGGGFEAAPDWPTLQRLKSFANDLLEDIARLRPEEKAKPEDDPANAEMARLVVATLRARVEAHRAAA